MENAATTDTPPASAGSLIEITHPVRGDALTPLERELWRFRMVALEAQAILQGIYSITQEQYDTMPSGIMFTLHNHGHVVTAKFLEVWADFGRLAKDEARVVDTRRAVTPLVDRIRVWPGLEQYRNTIIAHPYTTKDGRLVGPWQQLEAQRAPTYHAEGVLLLDCVTHAVAAILAVFYEEYRALGPTFRSAREAAFTVEAGPGIDHGTKIRPTILPLLEQVDAAITALGVAKANPVFAEFRAEVAPNRPS